MSINTDVHTQGETVVVEGKATLNPRKPLYAVVGAGDLAVAQLKELPAETQAVVDSQVKKAQALLASIREELKSRLAALQARTSQLQDKAEGLKPNELKATVDGYVDRAKEAYTDLATRGEKVLTKVSDRPGVKRVLGHAEDLFEVLEETAEDAVDAITGEPKPAPRKTAPARKSPPRKVTSR